LDTELETVLNAVKNGDENAYARLLEQYEPVVDHAVRRFVPSFGMDDLNGDRIYGEDDLRQDANIALYRAALAYRPEGEGKSVSFGLYAKICINNALISVLRKHRSELKRRARAMERQKTEKHPADPLQTILSQESAEEMLKQICERLSPYEREIFEYYIAGKSAGEIAERLGKEEKSVSNALYRMRVKIKGLLKIQ
jgi:RNA polymerase sigma factor (sigma-70 family)